MKDEIFDQHPNGVKQVVKAAEIVVGVVVGALEARKLINILAQDRDR